MERLNELAVQLMNCRKRGNRLTLECVLQSARILSEAKSLAGKDFGAWLIEQARMDRATAYRHLGVSAPARQARLACCAMDPRRFSNVTSWGSKTADSAAGAGRGSAP
jgi:hypothetical protein